MISLEKLFSLKNHVAIVTGGSRGIGRTCADFIAAAGADVAIVGTKQETAQIAAEQIAAEYHVRTMGIACRVENRDAVFKMVDQVDRELGIPDLLLNNAGICVGGDSENLSGEEWGINIDVNLNGAFYVMQAFGKKLLEKGKPGSIVCVASMNAHISCTPQHEAAYNASKAGLVMLAKSLAVEWGKRGIRVNSVSPGYIMTEMTKAIGDSEMINGWISMSPTGTLGEESDIGGAVVYLLSGAARYTTGAEIIIDGAFTLV